MATALLLSLLTATVSQAAPSHADAGHDDHLASAGLTSIPHNESDHELRANVPSDAAHPLHCLVCHWARAFRPLASPSAEIAPTLEARYHVQRAVAPAPRSVAPPQLSLRSPPASPSVA
ncbi:MAG TPA: hypothetical protein VIY56_19800 [Vicinamibacterales bacterium]